VKIVEKALHELMPYAHNPRNNEPAVDAVAKSIQEFGFKVPIVIDQNNEIVAGHTRYKASQKLGLEKVPCIIADDLTNEQIRAFRLVDNKTSELASWNNELLQFELGKLESWDMSAFGFGEIMEQTALAKVKEVEPEPVPENPKTKLGEIYQLGIHRLICGDCTDKDVIDKLMNGAVADLIITDPPYNVNYESSNHLTIANDNLGERQFAEFLDKSFGQMARVLKKGGAWYIFHSDSGGEIFRQKARERLGKIRQCLIWNKNAFVVGRQDYHWKHEPILYGWKDGESHYFVNDRTQSTVHTEYIALETLKKKDAIKLLKEILQDEQNTTVIDCDKPTINVEHPTMKPIKLIAKLTHNSSRKGENILDPFGGSGSTLIAAEQLGRIAYICELDPKYCDATIARYEKLTNTKAIKVQE